MTTDFLIIGLFLLCAKLLEGAASRFKQSSLLAYLVVGIVLGIWFEPGEEAKLFFEVGVLFLFFLIGIDEIDISGFVETLRGRFFVAALVSFAIPFAANLAIFLYVIGLSAANAVTLASLMGLSSLGIAARVLGDLGRLKEPVGLEIFTTVVMVEIVGLLVAGFALEESSHPGELGGWKIAILLGEIILFVAASWVLSAKVVPRVLVFLRRIIGAPQLASALMVGSMFIVVWGAHEIGMDEALAALVFGMVNSGLPRRLRNDILPSIRGLSQGVFVPLFFASAGTQVDLSFTNLPVSTLATVIPVVILAKAAGSLMGVTVARLSRRLAVASGSVSDYGATVLETMAAYSPGVNKVGLWWPGIEVVNVQQVEVKKQEVTIDEDAAGVGDWLGWGRVTMAVALMAISTFFVVIMAKRLVVPAEQERERISAREAHEERGRAAEREYAADIERYKSAEAVYQGALRRWRAEKTVGPAPIRPIKPHRPAKPGFVERAGAAVEMGGFIMVALAGPVGVAMTLGLVEWDVPYIMLSVGFSAEVTRWIGRIW